jgi:small subunit ribosomal protein S20
MANIKQQIKRIITNNKKRANNASFKTALKTAMKNVEKAVANNNLAEAEAAFNLANKKLDKAVTKGVLHKNNVARHKSRLTLLVNTLRTK